MKRDLTPEEARDAEISERATKHYARLRDQLQAGNAEIASAIGEAISQYMTDEICNEQMTYAVMPNGGRASPRYQQLVEKALEDMAEVEATKEVEQIENAHPALVAESRVELRQWEQIAVNQ